MKCFRVLFLMIFLSNNLIKFFGHDSTHFPQPQQFEVTIAVLFFKTIAFCGQILIQSPKPTHPKGQSV